MIFSKSRHILSFKEWMSLWICVQYNLQGKMLKLLKSELSSQEKLWHTLPTTESKKSSGCSFR